MFTQTSMDNISSGITGIYRDNRGQSERDLPNIGAFRNELSSVEKVKATTHFSRVYILLLAIVQLLSDKGSSHKEKDEKLMTMMMHL